MKKAIYQLFVRLFSEHCKSNVINGSIEDNGCGKFNDINDNVLEEIKRLGITDIWLTGVIQHATTTTYKEHGIPPTNPLIVKGKAGSPYAITNYFDVDPDLSECADRRFEEFERLVERIHRHGMNVIIDFIPNHVSRQYISANGNQIGRNERQDYFFERDNNFYYLQGQKLELPQEAYNTTTNAEDYYEYPAKVTGDDCMTAKPTCNNWYETVKLNYGIDISDGSQHFEPIPHTWHCMLEILRFWRSKKVDGFRCDMAEMVPTAFWKWVINEIKAEFPDTFFIAEIYKTELYDNFIHEAHFDYLYDKVDLYDNLKNIIKGYNNVDVITKSWQRLGNLNDYMLRFLENHDEERIASRQFAGEPDTAIPALAVSAMMHKGPIMIYNGQEFGEKAEGVSGFSGDDGRTTIFDYWSIDTIKRWLSDTNKNNSEKQLDDKEIALRNKHKEIIRFATENKLISEGDFYDLMWINEELYQHRCYAFLRNIGRDFIIIVANFSDKDITTKIRLTRHVYEYLGIDKDYSEIDMKVERFCWSVRTSTAF